MLKQRFAGWTARNPRTRHRPQVEELETRTAPAANLRITNALLVDANNNPISEPVVGGMTFVRAHWTTTDLTTSDQYVVRFEVDGVPLSSSTITGAAGVNLPYFWWLGGWYASPGTHTVTVTVDGLNSIAETDETDNTITFDFSPVAPTTLPELFIWPMGGDPMRDWTVVNYNDVDPRSGINIDYQGGPYQYDGHNAFDLTLPNFARMDAGVVPVYAAAAGVVTVVQDGYFDRETSANSNPANYLVIDHGNDWRTVYYHFARDTLTVQVNDVVTAGQLLGLVGSSGSSTDAHLHFAVTYRNGPVETMYDPASYFQNPPV